MEKEQKPVYWSARNNNNSSRHWNISKSLRAAVLAAHKYVDDELGGEGTAIFAHEPNERTYGHMDEFRYDSKDGYDEKWTTVIP